MATPAWDLFVLLSVALVLGVVVLARRTARALGNGGPIGHLSKAALYLNVAVSHALVLGLVALMYWWTAVPRQPLGMDASPDWRWLVVLALVLIAFNELADRVARTFGVGENPLRELLTPETWIEWAILAGLLLPIIAITEEVLFRGVLIGTLGAGTAISPVFLVFGSGLAFGGAHTAQGRLGVGIAALLGIALGAVYYWSGSLWLVIGAHYLVDLVEFARHARD